MAHAANVKWTRGGEAIVTRVVGEMISLVSTVPSPPGSSLEGALDIREDLVEDETRPLEGWAGRALRVKVSGSKKQPDGSFVIEGRCVDMTKELRKELEGISAKSPIK